MKTKLLLSMFIVAMVSIILPQSALRAQTEENIETISVEQAEVLPGESTPADGKDTPTDEAEKAKKPLPAPVQTGKVFLALQAVLIPTATLILFVFILLYFFRRKLLSLLPASSKERKMIGDTLKRFGIDIDTILPPPPPK